MDHGKALVTNPPLPKTAIVTRVFPARTTTAVNAVVAAVDVSAEIVRQTTAQAVSEVANVRPNRLVSWIRKRRQLPKPLQ